MHFSWKCNKNLSHQPPLRVGAPTPWKIPDHPVLVLSVWLQEGRRNKHFFPYSEMFTHQNIANKKRMSYSTCSDPTPRQRFRIIMGEVEVRHYALILCFFISHDRRSKFLSLCRVFIFWEMLIFTKRLPEETLLSPLILLLVTKGNKVFQKGEVYLRRHGTRKMICSGIVWSILDSLSDFYFGFINSNS